MKNEIVLSLLFTFPLYAADLSQSFPPGKGSLYQLEVQGPSLPGDVSIYVAGSSKDSVRIEYFLSSRESLIPVEMWQQFEIIPSTGGTKVTQGFVQTKE